MDPELLAIFEAEMTSNLEDLEQVLLEMESEPTKTELANDAFRVAHNLKGGAGLMEMETLGSLAHTAEELLEDVRSNISVLDVEAINVLLKVADLSRDLIEQEESDELIQRAEDLKQLLRVERERLRAGSSAPSQAPSPESVAPVEPSFEATPSASATSSEGAFEFDASADPFEFDANTPFDPNAPLDPALAAMMGFGFEASPESSDASEPKAASSAPLSAPPSAHKHSAAPQAAHASAQEAPSSKVTRVQRQPRRSRQASAASAPPSADEPSDPAPVSLAPLPTDALADLLGPSAQEPQALLDTPPPHAALASREPQAVSDQAWAPTPAPVAQPTPAPVAQPTPAPVAQPIPPSQGGGSSEGGGKKPESKPESKPKSKAKGKKAASANSERTETIRVRVDLLEELINYVGELVVARNRLLQLDEIDERTDSVREENTARINELTTELHSLVMKTRMQPIQSAWSVMTRLVRDVALQLNKKVELTMKGGDTELDRNILANLQDPLTHMVRNAVSHGIEMPEDRLAAGKVEHGTLSLVAYHAAGQAHIEVTDDGRGLSRDKIADKAIRVGLTTPEEVRQLTDAQVFDFIFKPGFSTAEVVDSISGRGVGLDVVRSRIEAMGGAIDVETVFGRGMTFRMRLPLTLAIMPCLVVSSHDSYYCIPQPNLLQILDLESEEGQQAVNSVGGVHYYRLGNDLIPLVHIGHLLHDEPSTDQPKGYVVVVAAGKVRFGVIVDDVLNTEEMVVKPLGVGLESSPFFSGTTVRGDGRVLLILDLDGIGRSEIGDQSVEVEQEEEQHLDERVLLLCDVSETQRIALEVSSVITVRAIMDTQVRSLGSEQVIEYMGRPVVLRALLSHAEPAEELILVHTQDNIIALPVLRTLDVVHTHLELTPGIGPHWSEGVAFINEVPTSILNLNALGDGRAQLF